MLNFIIWNIKPQIADLGAIELRYYSMLFALSFVIGYFIMLRMLKRENLDTSIMEKLTIYVILSTIIGARLGHCLFYEFGYYSEHPLEIILPWRGTIGQDFRFTGYQGLASHGAAAGILIGMYLFSRKTRLPYLWSLDRLAILVALAAFMIRTGNLMNSEIYGKHTGNDSGFVFVQDFNSLISDDEMIDKIWYKKKDTSSAHPDAAVPLEIYVRFSQRVKDTATAELFASRRLKRALAPYIYQLDVTHPRPEELDYRIEKQGRKLVLSAGVYGLPRYPTQIMEASAYLVIFLLLLWIYIRKGTKIKNGFYIGLFMVLVFLSRFFIEFIKADQEAFESTMLLNMGQLLSIPLVLAGLVLVYLRRPSRTE
ncbi:MAG: prolipoprotein diacylglyceryl transferase [Bacteroidales bacterium]|nr:prolipoprotein diacylglyceryl transferase [Bacteroidales bacterium]